MKKEQVMDYDAGLTQKALKEYLHYSPVTGIFTWVKRKQGYSFNKRAGSVCTTHWYVNIGLFGRVYKAHRLAWLYVHGKFPEEQLDHINHDGTDNRMCNLRESNDKINLKNKSMYVTNTSGQSGVVWHKCSQKWLAQISVSGVYKHLGVFNCITAAILTRKAAEVKYNYHCNHGKHVV